MENNNINTGANEGQTEAAGTEKTFTQEEVNRIVQERLARSKNKEPDELAKREADLKAREMALTIKEQLSSAGLPQELASVITAKDEQEATEKINTLKKYIEQPAHKQAYSPVKGGEPNGDPIRKAMGLA